MRVSSTSRAQLLRLAARMAEEKQMIGERMRERREELPGKPSQRACAEKLPGSVQGSEWSRWERGEHRPEQLEGVAKVLETTIADLVAGPLADREKPADRDNDLLGQLGEKAIPQKLIGRLDQILDQQAALLAAVSEVRSEQEDQRKLLERDSRGRAAKNK